ncbi:MAG: cupin domain-containing protein [Bacteroidetes bacterium]|nr:cupin domain-containing protein [Bacteroidota bacterium]
MNKVIIERLNSSEIEKRDVKNWPIWTKEISKFTADYETDEECLFLEGEVIIETTEGDFKIVAGDFVTFKSGLVCVWDIKEKVKKHYNFK